MLSKGAVKRLLVSLFSAGSICPWPQRYFDSLCIRRHLIYKPRHRRNQENWNKLCPTAPSGTKDILPAEALIKLALLGVARHPRLRRSFALP